MPDPDGFTSRFQIRRENAKDYYGIYIYQGNTTEYGDDELGTVEVVEGTYVELAQRVKMNSAYGVSDGELEFWVDGAQQFNLTNINWIDTQKSGQPAVPSIRGLAFNSFHGGSVNDDFSSDKNEYPAYTDIAVKY